MLEDCVRQLVSRLRAAGCEGSSAAGVRCQAAAASGASSEATPAEGGELAATPAPVPAAQNATRAGLSPKAPPPLVTPRQQQAVEVGDLLEEGVGGAEAAAPAAPAAVAPASSPQPPSSPPLPSPLLAQSPPTQLLMQMQMQGAAPATPAGAAAPADGTTACTAADPADEVVCSMARAGSTSGAMPLEDAEIKDAPYDACSGAAVDQVASRMRSPKLDEGITGSSHAGDAPDQQHHQHQPADSAIHISVSGHPLSAAAERPEGSSIAVAAAAPDVVVGALGSTAAATCEVSDVEAGAAACNIASLQVQPAPSHGESGLVHLEGVAPLDGDREVGAATAPEADMAGTAESTEMAAPVPVACAEGAATAPAGSAGAAAGDWAAGLGEQLEEQQPPSGATFVDTGASLEASDAEAIGWLGGAHVPVVLSARRGDRGPLCEDRLGAYDRYAQADGGVETTGTDGSIRCSGETAAGVGGSLELGEVAVDKDGGDTGLPHPQTQQLQSQKPGRSASSSCSSSYADAVEGSAADSDASRQLGGTYYSGGAAAAIAAGSRGAVDGDVIVAGLQRQPDAASITEAVAQQPWSDLEVQQYQSGGSGAQQQQPEAAAEVEAGAQPLLAQGHDAGGAGVGRPAACELREAHASSQLQPPTLLREPSLRARRQGDFMAAARSGDMAGLMALLQQERFLDVNAREPGTRNTPLHYAARCGDRAAVEALLRAGAFTSSRNKEHATPLHWAVSNRHTPAALCLIHWRADVTAADHDGFTPLHWAALNGDVTTASALLAAGASPTASAAGARKETPLSLARSNAHAAMAGLLQQHAAAAATAAMGAASSSNVGLGMAVNSTSTSGTGEGAALLPAPAATTQTTAAVLGLGAAWGPGSSGASPAFGSTAGTPFATSSSGIHGAYPVIPLVDTEVVGAVVAVDGSGAQPRLVAAESSSRPLAPPAPECEVAPSAPPVAHAGYGAPLLACAPSAEAVAARGGECGGGKGSLAHQHPHLHPQPDLMPLAWGSVASAAAAAAGARGVHAQQHPRKDSTDVAAANSSVSACVSHNGIMQCDVEATAAAAPSGSDLASPVPPAGAARPAQPRWVDPPPPPPFQVLEPQPLHQQLQPLPPAVPPAPSPSPLAAAHQTPAPSFWAAPPAPATAPPSGVAADAGSGGADVGAMPWAAAGGAGLAMATAPAGQVVAAGRQAAGRCLAAKVADTLEERELLRACQDGNIAAVRRLLSDPGISISPNCHNEMRRTPLHLACGASGAVSCDLVGALVAAGADVNAADGGGHTPLIEAAWFGRAEVVRVLLRAGAVIDARCKAKGREAVHWAARNGNRAALKVLLESGVDINAKDKSGMFGGGRTPLDLAKSGGSKDCVQLLKQWGAK
ncbi:hypothetical protein HYH02_005010 [Chlamydomonas schloesseri]|uniref:Uncharacterized protein n=1 Tax=Chlamydomonas schloesseri TaxID=2026947 RepID=A0A835WMH0_9CHLO|nr:hypothetical protein HYH02_005010 [Chlamydomonas schloesseri]|eukprot:KAG2450509.1 hypothetical protein HYH02_005010 [Chlamydomonas schloesseri]